MSLNVLLSRMRVIEDECGVEMKSKSRKDAKPMDAFTRMKKDIARDMRQVRERLKERDELLGKHATAATTAELSSQIRLDLRRIEEDVDELEAVYDDLEKKHKKPTEAQEEMLEQRAAQLQVVHDHLDECKRLEKARYSSRKERGNRSRLMRGAGVGGGVGAGAADLPDDPTMTSLAPIDDEELEAELAQLQRRNEEIDEGLDVVADQVGVLGEIAISIGQELDTQNVMLEETNENVDRVNAHMKKTNKELKRILDSVGKDKVCMYMVLFIFLLFLILVVYNKSQGR